MQDIEIIHEDADIIVCYKPAGLAVQSNNVTVPDLESLLRSKLVRSAGRGAVIHVVHRLDQPVEGLVVFARNREAAASLSKQVQEKGEMSKEYKAVVFGGFPEDMKKGELVDFIGKDAKTGSAVIVKEAEAEEKHKQGLKEARLIYEVLAERTVDLDKIVRFHKQDEASSRDLEEEERKISLVKIQLKTGRFHQIRAQFLSVGYPLMGDRRYFSDKSNDLSRELNIKNVALCAYHLSFKHPRSGEVVDYETEPRSEIFSHFE